MLALVDSCQERGECLGHSLLATCTDLEASVAQGPIRLEFYCSLIGVRNEQTIVLRLSPFSGPRS